MRRVAKKYKRQRTKCLGVVVAIISFHGVREGMLATNPLLQRKHTLFVLWLVYSLEDHPGVLCTSMISDNQADVYKPVFISLAVYTVIIPGLLCVHTVIIWSNYQSSLCVLQQNSITWTGFLVFPISTPPPPPTKKIFYAEAKAYFFDVSSKYFYVTLRTPPHPFKGSS